MHLHELRCPGLGATIVAPERPALANAAATPTVVTTDVGSFGDAWICPQCSLQNLTEDIVCQACGAPQLSDHAGRTSHSGRHTGFVASRGRDGESEDADDYIAEDFEEFPFGGILRLGAFDFRLNQHLRPHTRHSGMRGMLRNVALAHQGPGSLQQPIGRDWTLFGHNPRHPDQQAHDFAGLGNLIFQLAQHEPEEPGMEPAQDHDIAALPTHAVTAAELEAAPMDAKSCTICLEDFDASEVCRTLPCFHRFHRDCVDRWLARQGSCPICKHRVDGGDVAQ